MIYMSKCNICKRKFRAFELSIGGRCKECQKLLSEGKTPQQIRKIISNRGR